MKYNNQLHPDILLCYAPQNSGELRRYAFWLFCMKLIFLLPALFLTGCIKLTGNENYIPPNSEELGKLSLVHIYRPSSVLGKWNDVDILIDGKYAGQLKDGESVSIKVMPGIHEISIYDWDPASPLPRIYTRLGNPMEINFLAGKEYYLRWKNALGKLHFQLTDKQMHDQRQ